MRIPDWEELNVQLNRILTSKEKKWKRRLATRLLKENLYLGIIQEYFKKKFEINFFKKKHYIKICQ